MKKHNLLKGLVGLFALVFVLGAFGTIKASAAGASDAFTYKYKPDSIEFRKVSYTCSEGIEIKFAKGEETKTLTYEQILKALKNADDETLYSKKVKFGDLKLDTTVTFTVVGDGKTVSHSDLDDKFRTAGISPVNPIVTFKTTDGYTYEVETREGVLGDTTVVTIAQKLSKDDEAYLSVEGNASRVITTIMNDEEVVYGTVEGALIPAADYAKDKVVYGKALTSGEDVGEALTKDTVFNVTLGKAFADPVYDPTSDSIKVKLNDKMDYVKAINVVNVGTSSAKAMKANKYISIAAKAGAFYIPLSEKDKTKGFNLATTKDAYLYYTCYPAADGTVTANAVAGKADVKKATIALDYSKANQADTDCDVVSSITVVGTSGGKGTTYTPNADDYDTVIDHIQFSTDGVLWTAIKNGTIVEGFEVYTAEQEGTSRNPVQLSTSFTISGKATNFVSAKATYTKATKTWSFDEVTSVSGKTADISGLAVKGATESTENTEIYIYNNVAKTIALTGAQLYAYAYPATNTKTTLYYRYIGNKANGEDDASTRTIKSAKLTVAVAAKAPKVAVDANGITKSIKNGFDFATVRAGEEYTVEGEDDPTAVTDVKTAKAYFATVDKNEANGWKTILPFNKSGVAESEVVSTSKFVPGKFSATTNTMFTKTKVTTLNLMDLADRSTGKNTYVFVRKSATDKKPATNYNVFAISPVGKAPEITSAVAADTLKVPTLTKGEFAAGKTFEYIVVKADDVATYDPASVKWTPVAKGDVIDTAKLKYKYSTNVDGKVTKVSGAANVEECVLLVRTVGTAVKAVDEKAVVALPSAAKEMKIVVSEVTKKVDGEDATVKQYKFQ